MAKLKEKIRYEVDPHNRLIIAESGKRSGLTKFRHVVDGKFKIKDKNSLLYHIKKAQGYNVPQQIKFSGNWCLDKNRNLVFTLNKWGNQIAGNKLTLKGEITNVKSNSLVFSLITKTPDNRTKLYAIKLSGSWQVDKYNKLIFNVEKERKPFDALTLEGIWQIGKQNQLVYEYTKRKLKTKYTQTRKITFRGHWDIENNFRLSYILSGTRRYPITISGRWKINKEQNLTFEARYRRGRLKAIILGADIKLTKRNKFELRLKNERGKYLGIKLTFSRKMLKGIGQTFIKTALSKEELGIHGGLGLRW